MNRNRHQIYDELLVLRCQQRDVQAWDQLVERWNPRLLYYLRRLIDHEQDATNTLQEVWLKAFRGIRRLRDPTRFAPWIYSITRRTAITHFRRAYQRQECSQSELVEREGDHAQEEQLNFDNVELIHYGLGRLGLPSREVLTLFFLEDLSTAEIAELLGIPAGTVKSRLFTARRELHRILERECRP